jgi:hypothetical protein
MIPPEFLQSLTEKLCRDSEARAVVIGILHTESQCELVFGGPDAHVLCWPDIFRKFAASCDEDRPDEAIAEAKGANRPGDVFQINDRAVRWVGLLVTAKEIFPEGIAAFAQVPQGSGKCTRAFARLSWREINFIGRPGSGMAQEGTEGAV